MDIKSLIRLLFINSTVLLSMLLGVDIIFAFTGKDTSPRKISATYHHGLLPDAAFSHEWVRGDQISERTNAFGFRFTKSDPGVQNLNEYKTVVIGDSFTEGVGLRYEQTFASLLPSQFNPIANMGVISYSPFIYRHKLIHFKKQGLDPEYLIQIIDVSDIQDEYHYRTSGFVSIRMPSFIEETRLSKTYTYKLILRGIWMLNKKELFTSPNKKREWLNQYYSIRDPYALPTEPPYYQEGKTSLIRGIEQSINLFPKTTHYVIAYNWGTNPMTDNGKELYAKYISDLRDMSIKHPNSNFCDMTDVVDVPNGYIKGDVHWNYLGNQQISSNFYRSCFIKSPNN